MFKLWQICFEEIAGQEDDWRSKLDGGNEVLSKIVDQLAVANFSSNLGIRIRRENLHHQTIPFLRDPAYEYRLLLYLPSGEAVGRTPSTL